MKDNFSFTEKIATIHPACTGQGSHLYAKRQGCIRNTVDFMPKVTDKKTRKINYLSERLIFLNDQLQAAIKRGFPPGWINYLKSQIKTVRTNREKRQKSE